MTMSFIIEKDIHFQCRARGRQDLREGTEPSPAAPATVRVPRVARLMALAIRFDGLLQTGRVRDQAELARLGQVTRARVSHVADSTVAKYMPKRSKPPSQTWKTFLKNHVDCLASIDFCVVPTATFRVLYLFVVLLHDRRRLVHFAITAHPSANWVGRQLHEAFPFETAPRYLIRDRDSIYGREVRQTLEDMGVEEVLIAPRSPWQSPYVERLIGSLRRECLDHVIVVNERHLHRIVSAYVEYYHRDRAHLALNRDAPVPREVEPAIKGRVVSQPKVGGLHHRYRRIA